MKALSANLRTLLVLGLAISAIAGFATVAGAHSEGACVNAVVDSCNAQYPNNYAARLACTNNGLTQCHNHSHNGGGSVNNDDAPNNLAAETKPDARPIRPFRRFKRL